jgi:multidrug efflux pump subunit AcrB
VELNIPGNVVPRKMIENLQVSNMRGQLINIEKFVNFEERGSLELIRHYNGRRSITITGDVDEKIITSKEINKLVYDKFFKRTELNPGLKLIFGGEEKATQESMQSFVKAFFAALIAIYFILILLFDSWFQPFIIMTAIPFGFAGVVIVFFLHGLPLSFMGLIGCLGLLGIVVNDSLIMVSHLNTLRKDHKLNIAMILKGAGDRLRAVLLTTITTVAGTIPTIYGFGGSEPFIVPVVLAIAGGLIFATLITLILVPVLYSFQIKKEDRILL